MATILHRVNAGGSQVAATDGNIAWSADTKVNNNAFLIDPGSNNTALFPTVEPGAGITGVPETVFDTVRFDRPGGSQMQWAFDVPQAGTYEVRLYGGEGYAGASQPGGRVFDVAVEGAVPTSFNDIDLSQQLGYQTGGVISSTATVSDGTLNLEFLPGVGNPSLGGIEIVQLSGGTPPTKGTGEAVLDVIADIDDIQSSNYGDNSFQITNTGDKKIAKVTINTTKALYPDSVFDPSGQAGDTISKPLSIDTNGATGVVAPSNSSYLGKGGKEGFEAIELVFDENVDGGFESQETLGFSVDMDPNSVAGADKTPLDNGTTPFWDVGGVSGAELINSTFTVTYADGTTSTGKLQSDGSQAGSQALASQKITDVPVSLKVNNLGAGGVGTYNGNGPNVIVNGPAGQTARVVLTKGFIQPVSLDPFLNGTTEEQEYAPVLQSQLDALAASDFPANNAVEFQTVDVELTGANQNITNLFDFSDVSAYDFNGEDQLPLGFVASAIDPANDNLPVGAVTQPIYLEFEANTTPDSGTSSEAILHRVNAGGSQVAAIDGNIAWSADTKVNNSAFLIDPGSNNTALFPTVESGAGITGVPETVFDTVRFDRPGGSEMQWAFDVPQAGTYEVRLYGGEGYAGASQPGGRVFDVAVEGTVPTSFDDIDLSQQLGHQTGGVISSTVTVSDGTLNLEFLPGVGNPSISGIEIVQLSEPTV